MLSRQATWSSVCGSIVGLQYTGTDSYHLAMVPSRLPSFQSCGQRGSLEYTSIVSSLFRPSGTLRNIQSNTNFMCIIHVPYAKFENIYLRFLKIQFWGLQNDPIKYKICLDCSSDPRYIYAES